MKKYNQNLALPPVKDNLTPQERTYFYGTLLNNVKKHLVNSEDTKENSNQNIDLLLLDILPSPIFKEEMKKLGIEDAYSKLISLGVDFSKISIEEISKYLKVPSSVIRTTMIYVLNIYRETLNSNIDIATKVATGKIKVKKN
jgi:hypothetical protein